MTMPELTAETAELVSALKSIDRLLKRSSKAQATLTFAEGTLSFELPGMSVGVAASGDWPGRARISALFLRALAQVPPTSDKITFRVDGNRLHAGTSTVSCIWQAEPVVRIELPMNADLRTTLALAYRFTPNDIEQAGLRRVVAEAERERDSKVRSAHASLKDLGVTAEEIRALVDSKMREVR